MRQEELRHGPARVHVVTREAPHRPLVAGGQKTLVAAGQRLDAGVPWRCGAPRAAAWPPPCGSPAPWRACGAGTAPRCASASGGPWGPAGRGAAGLGQRSPWRWRRPALPSNGFGTQNPRVRCCRGWPQARPGTIRQPGLRWGDDRQRPTAAGRPAGPLPTPCAGGHGGRSSFRRSASAAEQCGNGTRARILGLEVLSVLLRLSPLEGGARGP